MLCAKEVSSYLGCVQNAWKSSYVTLRLPQVKSTIFLGFLIYCIVWGMPKIQSWRYRGLSIGRRANHTATSFQHCLHGGGFDGCLGLAGHTPVAHVDLNVFCCVLWLLNCYIKYFYKTIFKFFSLCLFFFFFPSIPTWTILTGNSYVMTPCGCAWKGQTGRIWMSYWNSGNVSTCKIQSVKQS